MSEFKENPYDQCTDWQRSCTCVKCLKDRDSFLALHSQCGSLHTFIDEIIYSLRLRDQEIFNLKQLLLSDEEE